MEQRPRMIATSADQEVRRRWQYALMRTKARALALALAKPRRLAWPLAALVCASPSSAEPGVESAAKSASESGAESATVNISSEETVELHLTKLWEVGGESDDWIFGNVTQIIEDADGNIYVLDGQLCHIAVFSPGGELLRTIGREGEGPGEFYNPQDLFHVPGGTLGVAQVFPGKIVELLPNGDPAGNFALPPWGSLKIFRAMGDDNKLVVAGSIRQGQGDVPGDFRERTFLKAFAPDGSELHHYHHEDHSARYGGMEFQEPEFDGFEWRWALSPDGNVAVATSFENYEVSVWDGDGSLDHVIRRPDVAPVRRTREEKEKWQRYYESITTWNPGSTFVTEPTFPAISTVNFQSDGSLWIQSSHGTWRTAPDVLAEFDVYDSGGLFQKKVQVRGPGTPGEDRVFLAGDRMYVVTQFFDSVADPDDIVHDAEPSRLIAYTVETQP